MNPSIAPNDVATPDVAGDEIERLKQRIHDAAETEDCDSIVAFGRALRSALWRRDSAVRAERARQGRLTRQIANRRGI